MKTALRAELEAIAERIDDWKATYGVASPSELEATLSDDRAADDIAERRRVLRRWENSRQSRETIRTALRLYDDLQALTDDIADAATVFPGINRIRKDWENVLTYLAEQNAIVILDEFPSLVDENEALPSLIQRLWDHNVADTGTTFVLTGSAIGMIHEIAIDGSSPLYGRISKRPNGKLEIGPLPFGAAMTFFPELRAR